MGWMEGKGDRNDESEMGVENNDNGETRWNQMWDRLINRKYYGLFKGFWRKAALLKRNRANYFGCILDSRHFEL